MTVLQTSLGQALCTNDRATDFSGSPSVAMTGLQTSLVQPLCSNPKQQSYIKMTSKWRCNVDLMLQCWFETLSWHHFDVTCKHSPISLHYEHQNEIILISLISAIVNVTWTSFWCLYPTVLITSLRHHCYVGSWFETSSWHHFDVTYQHPRIWVH